MFITLFQNPGLKNSWWEHLTHILLSAFIPHRSLMILMIPLWAHLPEVHNWKLLPLPVMSGEGQISGSFPLDAPSGQMENPDLHKSTHELAFGLLTIEIRLKRQKGFRDNSKSIVTGGIPNFCTTSSLPSLVKIHGEDRIQEAWIRVTVLPRNNLSVAKRAAGKMNGPCMEKVHGTRQYTNKKVTGSWNAPSLKVDTGLPNQWWLRGLETDRAWDPPWLPKTPSHFS